jgi:hypothetical protein
MKDVSVISARRAYEFAQDDIRLTLLSSQPVIAFIKQSFSFELATVAMPMETFGPQVNTIPPGLVFNYGIAPVPEESGTAIRFLHFEQRRIVIDVAGSSSALDSIFAHLCTLFGDLRTQEGYPAIGQPVGTKDYSEIRTTLDLDPRRLVPSPFLEAAEGLFHRDESKQTVVPVLTLRMPTDGEYPGASVPSYQTYTLDIRAGTSIADRSYYSAGPLDSESHVSFLTEIERSLQG